MDIETRCVCVRFNIDYYYYYYCLCNDCDHLWSQIAQHIAIMSAYFKISSWQRCFSKSSCLLCGCELQSKVTVSGKHRWCTVILTHTSRRGRVHRILMCVEKDVNHQKSRTDQETTGTNQAEIGRDRAMQEIITTGLHRVDVIDDPPVDHGQTLHATASDNMAAEGTSRHMYMACIQTTCHPIWSLSHMTHATFCWRATTSTIFYLPRRSRFGLRRLITKLGSTVHLRSVILVFYQHYRVTWRHRKHVQMIAHGHFPIGCLFEPYRYLASFPRYLAQKLRQRLLRDDVINDVMRPGSTLQLLSMRTI